MALVLELWKTSCLTPAPNSPSWKSSAATDWWCRYLTWWRDWGNLTSSTCDHWYAHPWTHCSLPTSLSSERRMPSSTSSTHGCLVWRRLAVLSTLPSPCCWGTSCSYTGTSRTASRKKTNKQTEELLVDFCKHKTLHLHQWTSREGTHFSTWMFINETMSYTGLTPSA